MAHARYHSHFPALWGAWEKAGILHRDVSVANIMIDVDSPSGKSFGFLNDWDHCKYKADLDDPLINATQSVGIPVSTYQHNSALSLNNSHSTGDVAISSRVYVALPSQTKRSCR